MDENYIDIVRKSLYGRPAGNGIKRSREMPRKEKKIKFAVDKYNSETVFAREKSHKIKHRQSTPFNMKIPKKKQTPTIQNSDSSFEEQSLVSLKIKNRKATPKKVTPKKRKMVIAFSSDSGEEDVKNSALSPSTSEMQFFNNTFDSPPRKILIENSRDSDDSANTFNLNNFFNTYEPSLNESITEAHSGIDNEFESELIRNVNIISSKANPEYSDEEEVEAKNGDTIVINDSESHIEISDSASDNSILEVTDRMQTAVVLEENNPIVVSDSFQEEIEYTSELSTVTFYNLEDCTVVILNENQSVCIHGYFKLRILYGKVDICGSNLDRTSKEMNLYSPRGSALLQLVNLTTEDSESYNINTVLSNLSLRGVVASNKCAIIKCTRLKDARIPFIEKYISQQIFPEPENDKLPPAVFQPSGSWNVVKESHVWNDILNDVTLSSKVMITGGKGVGKSTLLRYAINRLLNVFDKVRVIDLDPGQSEFAVPGCVGVVTVTEPILGPNYTHLKSTDRSFLSNINVGLNPKAYIKCVDSLITYYNTLEKCPTLINYMGFAQGIGINIVSSAISYIQPTDVVQIQSRYNRKNFISDLTVDVVKENRNMFTGESTDLWYNLHVIGAMNDENEGWSLEARQSREMCVLAYLGQMIRGNAKSLVSHELPMYEVKLSSIKLSNPEREEIPPAAINANLVALCSVEEDSNIFICFGYGVVRGIDLDTETLVLLTPEPPTILEEVSHLVLTSVSLPPAVYMTPDGVTGNIPYIMDGELISLGQITKRTYVPMNKK